jgi:hypothetical protein
MIAEAKGVQGILLCEMDFCFGLPTSPFEPEESLLPDLK